MNYKKSHVLINGVGIGLRACHYDYILQNLPKVNFFEALSDNYFNDSAALGILEAVRDNYPITLHSVGMSLGSIDELNLDYLKKLKNLINIIQPVFVSDHLAWVSTQGYYFHDLLPLPMTKEAINHVSERILKVQDYLQTKILIENPSKYFEYKYSSMSEWEFINEIIKIADCEILLDLNNIYVSAYNNNFSIDDYLNNINFKKVKQLHLAGYAHKKGYLFDMHNQDIHSPVWSLYKKVLDKTGPIPTLIERDDNIPPFIDLYTEYQKAAKLMDDLAKIKHKEINVI